MYNKKLSEHFTLGEISGKRPDNVPKGEHLINALILVHKVLEPIRAKFGAIRINSGYRCKDYNQSIGGATNSQHTFGLAADIVPMNCEIEGVFKYIVDNLEFDQAILETGQYSKWIHVSYNLGENRKQAMTAKVTNEGTHYSKWG